MSESGFQAEAPDGFELLAVRVVERIGPSLQALLLFGSCLAPGLSQASSVPDLLAIVDDLDAALVSLRCGPIVRALGRTLPPFTLAFHEPGARPGPGHELRAKLNLIALSTARQVLAALPDLYLAGRMSKPVALLWACDVASAEAARAVHEDSLAAVIERALRRDAGDRSVSDAVDAVIGLSYQAEVRPEGPEKVRALRKSFADFYARIVPARILSIAERAGFAVEGAGPELLLRDLRGAEQRAMDRRSVSALLRRSRMRAILRWPRQLIVYRGAVTYVLGKWRRVLRQRAS
jgi:hypothetical protein